MSLFYADASALVKLVREEPETEALRAFVSGAAIVTCELVLVEIPRAIRRAVGDEPSLPLEELLERAGELFAAIALLPLERAVLTAAGAIAEPGLRSLDAIHVAAALELGPLGGFLSYDERQAAAARLSGLRTYQPS